MLISELLHQKPHANPDEIVTCSADDAVSTAIAHMAQHNVGAVVVCREKSVVGIFTERDVLTGLHRNGSGFLDTPMHECMVTKVIIVRSDQSVDEALELMNQNRIRHLPVVDQDQLVDVLSIRDVIVEKLNRVKNTAEFLQQQVQLGSKPLPM